MMRGGMCGWLSAVAVTAGLVLLAGSPAPAQPPAKGKDAKGKEMPKDTPKEQPKTAEKDGRRPVTFVTADGCELIGTYYAADKGRDAPAVMLVHRLGSDHTKDGWNQLAAALRERGYSVLAFDLRGHGGSTRVTDQFFRTNSNRDYLRSPGNDPTKKRKISNGEFRQTYLPVMANDLIAARRFLDGENDAGTCNSASLFVVGAQEGANLAALWAANESIRRIGNTGSVIGVTANVLAGDAVAGLALINPTSKVGSVSFRYNDWYEQHQGLRDHYPTLVVYGDGNPAAKADGHAFFDHLTRKPKERNELTREFVVKTSLPGQEMIGKPALGVDAEVLKFFDTILSKRREKQWVTTDVNKQTTYFLNLNSWQFGAP